MQKSQGFTLIELLIVMAIIAMLGALVGPKIFKGFDKAKCDAATSQIGSLGASLDQHRIDVGKYPRSLEGLLTNEGNSSRWDGPYLSKKKIPVDPWDNEYVYKYPGTNGDYDLSSLGGDGREGGDKCPDADINSWE
ncbi:type II secretion system major pseudopilin GspG [Candidatus Albibeggiatoa sp. nov. NOAA]|uniref:type II secretion system major pseudopilin GspG n=1 Tax=Candidatus Albibeggiatoa sp. nov. NOAA TaxID=3162724 RepID=UPI0032F3B7C4|nr:type II secretion system major pseudopilin GspG [Thiotrichaceae bacterium]